MRYLYILRVEARTDHRLASVAAAMGGGKPPEEPPILKGWG